MANSLPPDTRILMIDDEPQFLKLLDIMLTRIGAAATGVETAAEGLDLLRAESFNLLILDLMLPDIDGFDVLAQLREDKHFDDLPVLILSAKADPEAIRKGLALGADGYLTKPYLPNTLTNRVYSLITEGRRQAS